MPLPSYYSPEGSFRHLIDQIRSPMWMRTNYSSGFFGVLVGTVADEAVEAWNLICRMPLLLDSESPDDILPIIALDRRLPRYYTETAAQHRLRLWNAWDIYSEGGTEEVIEKQLLAAGFGPTEFLGEWGNPDVDWEDDTYFFADRGAYVEFRPLESGPRGEPAPYRTQFWIVFKEDFHPVTGYAEPWGDFIWGDTTPYIWDYEGFSDEFERLVVGLIKKWKPSDHVFRGFTFLVNDIPWGQEDIDWEDSTVIWGGSVEVPIPL